MSDHQSPQVPKSEDWQIHDVLAVLDGCGMTITDDKQVTRTLHSYGLMRSTPVGAPLPPTSEEAQ